MINKLESYGEWTYKGAWVLEITAAIVGLSIAALLLYQSLEQGGWPAVINMIPFIGASVMVAFAELTKIPLATLLVFCSTRIQTFRIDRTAWNGVHHIRVGFPRLRAVDHHPAA